MSWFGLGFAASMTNTDMAIIELTGKNLNVVNLTDRYSTG